MKPNLRIVLSEGGGISIASETDPGQYVFIANVADDGEHAGLHVNAPEEWTDVSTMVKEIPPETCEQLWVALQEVFDGM